MVRRARGRAWWASGCAVVAGAGAVLAACRGEVVLPGAGGDGGGPSEVATSSSGEAKSSSSGPVVCATLDLAGCRAAPECVALLDNLPVPGGAPPPADIDVGGQDCCTECIADQLCAQCHKPKLSRCLDAVVCAQALPADTCGYLDPGKCP